MYECHITINAESTVQLLWLEALAGDIGWKFSRIDGDPVLGKGVFTYFTRHDTNADRMKSRMQNAVARLSEAGFHVVREKIEHIIYDTKTGIG